MLLLVLATLSAHAGSCAKICAPGATDCGPTLGFIPMGAPAKVRKALDLKGALRIAEDYRWCQIEGKISRTDVITAINGVPLDEWDRFNNAICELSAGTEVTLGIYRNGQHVEVKNVVHIDARDGLKHYCYMPGEPGDPTIGPTALALMGPGGTSGGTPATFVSPFMNDGTLAPWTSPTALSAMAADLAGAAANKAATMAAKQAASQVPMVGGVLSGAAGKAAEAAVDAALSSKITGDTQFTQDCELVRHMEGHKGHPDYAQAKVAVTTVYPELTGRWSVCAGGAASTPGAESPSTGNTLAELEKAKALLDAGAITQEEFDVLKKRILGL